MDFPLWRRPWDVAGRRGLPELRRVDDNVRGLYAVVVSIPLALVGVRALPRRARGDGVCAHAARRREVADVGGVGRCRDLRSPVDGDDGDTWRWGGRVASGGVPSSMSSVKRLVPPRPFRDFGRAARLLGGRSLGMSSVPCLRGRSSTCAGPGAIVIGMLDNVTAGPQSGTSPPVPLESPPERWAVERLVVGLPGTDCGVTGTAMPPGGVSSSSTWGWPSRCEASEGVVGRGSPTAGGPDLPVLSTAPSMLEAPPLVLPRMRPGVPPGLWPPRRLVLLGRCTCTTCTWSSAKGMYSTESIATRQGDSLCTHESFNSEGGIAEATIST